MWTRMRFVAVLVGLVCGRAAAQENKPLTLAEAKAIGKEAFLWGMHPVAIYHLRYNTAQNEKSPRFGGVNRMHWDRKPMHASDRTATTPNATTLYGSGVLDLSKEPVVITVPEIKDHYWSIQFADNYSRWWPLNVGSQFNAPGPLRRLLVGPNWNEKVPPEFVGADIMQSPSDFAIAIGRVALTDDTPEELKIVNGIQDSITLMSLSKWIAAGKKPVKPEDVPVTKGNYPTYPGMENVKEPGKLKGVEFLRWVSLVLNDPTFTKQEDGYAERMAFQRFERLGLKAGQPFDPDKLPAEIRTAVEEGIDEARAEATKAFHAMGQDMNGWRSSTDIGYKDSDWKLRAGYGMFAVLGPVPSRSHTGAFGLNDSKGRPLSGEYRYTITFDMNDLPPVTEFWEMPLYDRDAYFVDNPINRYSINSYMLKRGKLHTENGKLVIYVQADEPKDANQKKNWLPAPKIGGFQFGPRFYGPHAPLFDGSYHMPGVVRVE
ncbi:MAG: DUF1254 domain-containing protein [Planctomycetaceae bacterium]|nr:DUF1254 domain-containing protein [Planctomycetaceae bacterium]